MEIRLCKIIQRIYPVDYYCVTSPTIVNKNRKGDKWGTHIFWLTIENYLCFGDFIQQYNWCWGMQLKACEVSSVPLYGTPTSAPEMMNKHCSQSDFYQFAKEHFSQAIKYDFVYNISHDFIKCVKIPNLINFLVLCP